MAFDFHIDGSSVGQQFIRHETLHLTNEMRFTKAYLGSCSDKTYLNYIV